MAQFIKKNINQEQRDFLIFLDDEEIKIFTFSDIERKQGNYPFLLLVMLY